VSDYDPGYGEPEPRAPHVNGEAVEPMPEPAGYLWRPMQPPSAPALELVAPPPAAPKLLPHIGNTLVFGVIAFFSFIGGYIITLLALFATHRSVPLLSLVQQIAHNVTYAISGQAVGYALLWALAALVFSLWWHRSFFTGIHWNFAVARRWAVVLGGLGVITGLAITIAGNFVPMPKAPPILEDLTRSAAGAWALMAFGVTIAPLTEELAFRGFLLPSLVNIFRWLEHKRIIGEQAVRYFGIPLSIILTSIPFALMHSQQVSNSWGPVLLIGCVSIILCVIRLTTGSVAAGVVVHACYNLTLFAGLLYQTDWFRHLDKLKT